MTRCNHIGAMLTEYVSGDLTPDERTMVDDHLASCPACRAELALARDLTAGLATLPTAACPDHVSRNIMALVDADARPVHRRQRATWWSAAVLAAAVLLAVVLPRHAPNPTEGVAPTSDLAVDQARQDLIWTLAFTAEVIERSEMQTIANVWRQVRSRTPDSHAATINGGQG